jgi:hypothetical protein
MTIGCSGRGIPAGRGGQAVRITFTKISDRLHAVKITRVDGTMERAALPSREFWRHDLAHFVIESEVPLRRGYWGCVAAGASLSRAGIAGDDAQLAEQLAGPLQTLFRTGAGPESYAQVVRKFSLPGGAGQDVAARVDERLRQLRGHWKATPYGGDMEVTWPYQGR